MKIHFEGTMAEFQALFYGFSDDEEDGGFQPSGRARPPAFSVVSNDDEGDEDEPETDDLEGLQDARRVLPLPAPSKPSELTATLTDEERNLGWAKFCAVCAEWTVNFGETEEVEVEELQPLRNDEGKLVNADGKVLNRGDKAVQVPVKVTRERPKQPQPDRMELLRELGTGQYPKAVLVMAYEVGSLQRLVGKALLAETGVAQLGLDSTEEYHDYIDRVATNMVQISHMVFPDLDGTYDYSTKWKRSE